MNNNQQNIIIYNSADGKAYVSLYTKDGNIWMNQNQIAELFDTSVQNVSLHTINILQDNELSKYSIVKDYLTTATDSKKYNAIQADLQDLNVLKELGNKMKQKNF